MTLIPRLAPDAFVAASTFRFQTEAEFLIRVESDYYGGMKKLIREELGSRSLLDGRTRNPSEELS